MPFSCHLKMERRQSVKKGGRESKTPRYAVTTNAIQTARQKHVCSAQYSINFSSVHFKSMKTGEMPIGYGEPPQTAVK
jgi:hypothetical protein